MLEYKFDTQLLIAGEDLALIGFFMIPAGIIISVVSVLARIRIHDQAVPVTQLEGIRKGIVSSMGMLHLNLLSALLCANAAMTLLTGILVSKAIENLRRAEFELDEVQSIIDRAMLTAAVD